MRGAVDRLFRPAARRAPQRAPGERQIARRIRQVFAEPGIRDDPDGVGVTVSNAETMLGHLRSILSARPLDD